MSQEHINPQSPQADSSKGRPMNGVHPSGSDFDAPEGVIHTGDSVDPVTDGDFWQEDARLKQERLDTLARRIHEQQREAEMLVAQRQHMQAELEAERARMQQERAQWAAMERDAEMQPVATPTQEATAVDAESPYELTPDQQTSTAIPANLAGVAAPAAVSPVALASAAAAAVPMGAGSASGASTGGGGGGGPASDVPADFGFEDEHPLIKLVFTLTVDGRKYRGDSISLTHVIAHNDSNVVLPAGGRHVGLLQITFDSFSVTLQPDLFVQEDRSEGRSVFRIAEPTGAHLPQLRYILNSVIAGDVVGVDGMMRYSGPLSPKTAKPAAKRSLRDRVRSIMGIVVSTALVFAALGVVAMRYTTAYELHPVYVARDGQPMRATTAGQVGFLNPDAKMGEVLFSVNANTGDVLNFLMPCDCEVTVTKGISEGSTVLQTDLILTVFPNSDEIRVQTLMSIEGLSRALQGDRVDMDMSDGRRIPVSVLASETTRAASLAGDLFVPVELVPETGALTEADIGKSAKLRLSKSLLGMTGLN